MQDCVIFWRQSGTFQKSGNLSRSFTTHNISINLLEDFHKGKVKVLDQIENKANLGDF